MSKITLCGSIAFFDQMLEIKQQLESIGHEVIIPTKPSEEEAKNCHKIDWIKTEKNSLMKEHFQKINLSDSILVLNFDKKGIKNYIGSNTFLEMGVAMHLNKKIYLLNEIPNQDSKDEIVAMNPTELNGNLSLIQ